MNKVFLLISSLFLLSSCEKWDLFEKEKPCPVVAEGSLPSEVVSSFQNKYPGAAAEVWFNKDNTGYCASFTFNGDETLALFDKQGNFLKQGEDIEDEKGCECETD